MRVKYTLPYLVTDKSSSRLFVSHQRELFECPVCGGVCYRPDFVTRVPATQSSIYCNLTGVWSRHVTSEMQTTINSCKQQKIIMI